jgi:DNA-binding SARP family transcriptional activator
MARLHLTLLGGFGARVDARRVVFPSRKAQALLAYLSLPLGASRSRDKLATLLWGDTAAPQARNSLRQCLFGIRRILDAHRLRALSMEGESVMLDPGAVRVDIGEFEELITRGTIESVERALRLYRGSLLDGINTREAAFEDWLMGERRLLNERAFSALAWLVDRHAEAGAIDRAIAAGIQLVALDPLSESAHRALMRLYTGAGHRGAALRQYQACAEMLRRELGIEPEAETQRVYREILRQPAAPGSNSESRPAVRPRSGKTAVRMRPPLVGRALELGRLLDEAASARSGNGRVVALLGDAGIGKSRLAEEIEERAAAQRWRIVAGRAHETEQMLALGLWTAALQAAGLGSRAAVAELGPAWRSEIARLLPDLAEAGERMPRPPGSELRLFEAVARLLEQTLAAQPLLVVLEDLHWADEASLRLTAFLARRLESRPILVLATARIEELEANPVLARVLAELRRELHATEIVLGPLTRSAVDELVSALVTTRMDGRERPIITEQVWKISQGNPFIAVETVRARQEGVHLGAEGDSALPARVRAMLLGRIDRIGERSRQVLDAAAVIGRDFEFALVQRASGMDEATAASGLEELVRRRLVHGLGERFDFTHDRIWEVVYEEISPVRRRLLHAAVARAIQELHVADLAPHHASLGVHWTKGQAWDRALTHLRAAGTVAAGRGAYREAVTLFEQALEALGRLPEGRDTIAQAIDIRIELRDWLLPLGELERLAGYAREAERLSARLDDPRRLAVVKGHLAHYHWTMGEQDRAMEYANGMLAIGRGIEDRSLVTAGSFYLGEACYATGDVRRTVEVLRDNSALRGERMVERLAGPGLVPIMSRAWSAFALAELGRFDDALSLLEDALPAVEALEHPYSLMRVNFAIGVVHLARGMVDRALPRLERAADLVERWDIALDRPAAASTLGMAYALSGRPEQGLPLLERAVERLFPPRSSSVLSRRLGEGYLLAGRCDEALEWARAALDHARRRGGRGDEAWALLLLADVMASAPKSEPDRATALYEDARTRAEALGMEALRARCHLARGRLHARLGAPRRAAPDLALAVDLTRRMELGLWRMQAEAALARLPVTVTAALRA